MMDVGISRKLLYHIGTKCQGAFIGPSIPTHRFMVLSSSRPPAFR